jgi:hypothetical protein
LLSEESRNLINKSTMIGYASTKYANGWEYFCKYKGEIYYIIDDGTETEMIAKSALIKINEKQAIKLIEEVAHDKEKQRNAFSVLGIEDHGTHIQ